MDEGIKVYIKINEKNEIVAVNSSSWLQETTDWIEIDEGFGDKYCHAQNNYFDKPLKTENNIFRYQYIDNEIIEKSDLKIAQETDIAMQNLEKQNQIQKLKQELANTDYAIIKIAEGVATPEQYADVIAQRQAWRNEINILESEQ